MLQLVSLFRDLVSLFRGFSPLLLYHENAIKPLILSRNRRFYPLNCSLFPVALSPLKMGCFQGLAHYCFGVFNVLASPSKTLRSAGLSVRLPCSIRVTKGRDFPSSAANSVWVSPRAARSSFTAEPFHRPLLPFLRGFGVVKRSAGAFFPCCGMTRNQAIHRLLYKGCVAGQVIHAHCRPQSNSTEQMTIP